MPGRAGRVGEGRAGELRLGTGGLTSPADDCGDREDSGEGADAGDGLWFRHKGWLRGQRFDLESKPERALTSERMDYEYPARAAAQ